MDVQRPLSPIRLGVHRKSYSLTDSICGSPFFKHVPTVKDSSSSSDECFHIPTDDEMDNFCDNVLGIIEVKTGMF